MENGTNGTQTRDCACCIGSRLLTYEPGLVNYGEIVGEGQSHLPFLCLIITVLSLYICLLPPSPSLFHPSTMPFTFLP